ncbi:transcriptional regulator [Gordonibacter sp. An230]|uniref:helix-turn-helix domain-containing protein n=1 Tax=Gordonibacter sp. An230 TaxID=1965592 RepID=UPI000B3A640E|nr:helix-turn-helix domain-containing protein [Gordonibacter sp. An230]OUO89780.1 transcriptional regulator [Gordonibacter sp. An230]
MPHDLTAQDVKRIREKYGLTQQGFARLLGLGEASVVRYENGQKPSKANANLIRAADDPAFMKGCLERDGELLSAGQREKTEKIVYALVSFDEDGGIMDINEMYEITLQQEVLIEQIADLAGKVSNLLIAARDNGDAIAEAIYEDVLKQLALIRPNIIRRENSNAPKLSEIRGQIACLKSIAERREAKAA